MPASLLSKACVPIVAQRKTIAFAPSGECESKQSFFEFVHDFE